MGVVTIQNGGAGDFIQIYDDTHPQYRFVPALKHNVTWDHTPMTCYHVGNVQGGPETSHDSTESVIEGSHSQYVTGSLFDPEFEYSHFEKSHCSGFLLTKRHILLSKYDTPTLLRQI